MAQALAAAWVRVAVEVQAPWASPAQAMSQALVSAQVRAVQAVSDLALAPAQATVPVSVLAQAQLALARVPAAALALPVAHDRKAAQVAQAVGADRVQAPSVPVNLATTKLCTYFACCRASENPPPAKREAG
jgi:enhancing lycopene biosynthesis protein 2